MQDFVNKYFFLLYIFTLVFGILLYSLIGFDYTDELCALVLFIIFIYYVSRSQGWEINKVFLFVICTFLFYISYSFYIKSNSKIAIIADSIVQMKPYLAFFCVYSIAPYFSNKQKDILKKISIILWLLLLPVGIVGSFDAEVIRKIMGHHSYYAAAVVALSLTYLYSSNFSKNEKINFLIMLSLGLLSGRSKFYGFFILALVIILYFSNVSRIKINFKNIFILIIVFGIMLFVVRYKIELYFLQGIMDNTSLDKSSIARYVLYGTSLELFHDYFPLGSGFASFGTFYSGEFYSNIYPKYGIDNVWGMTRTNYSYMSDTFYPSLAQYGVVGIILYCLFWLYLLKKAFNFLKVTQSTKYIILVLLICTFFAIEGVADSTFTTHRGFFILTLLGLIFSEMKYIKSKTLENENITNK